MLNGATVPKINVNFCKIWTTLAVVCMYRVISTAAPFNNMTLFSQTTHSREWSFTHRTSWYHCSKHTSVFPAMVWPLKVFILVAPSHNPVVRVLIRHPTFSSGWGGSGSRWLSSGFPSPPPWEGDLLIIHIWVPSSCWSPPAAQRWVPGGYIQFPLFYLLLEVLH